MAIFIVDLYHLSIRHDDFPSFFLCFPEVNPDGHAAAFPGWLKTGSSARKEMVRTWVQIPGPGFFFPTAEMG